MARREHHRSSRNWIATVLAAIVVVFCVLSSIQEKTGKDFGVPSFLLPRMEQLGEFADAAVVAAAPGESGVRVHFIDVGQAKSILIEAPDKTVLIDAGDNDTAAQLLRYLENHAGKTIDLAIGTHPHADHIGGMDAVINALDVQDVLLPDIPHELVPTTATYRDMLEAIDAKHLSITVASPGEEFDLGGGAVLTVLAPIGVYEDINDLSVVTRLDYGKTSFLFTGDASADSEKDLLQSGELLASSVLDVGHHGSQTATTAAFLKQANPEIAVISCGANNSYGHPHREVMERLQARDIEIHRTDLEGTIIISSDGETLAVSAEKE